MRVDALIENCHLATMDGEHDAGVATLADGAIAIRDSAIAWLGRRADAAALAPRERIDARGGWLTPGLVDCHTHLVHAGDRSAEFEMRLEGASYEQIAQAGGGIVATVAATRAASVEALAAESAPRLRALVAQGVTTVEIKSGYGLDAPTELKMLATARRLGTAEDVDVRTTLLAAHALPREYAGRADAYVDEVCVPLVAQAAAAGLVDAVDAFCERIAFSPAQCARVFDAARAAAIPVKLHADQLSNLHGARLAAQAGALSADHLEYTDEAGVQALAAAGTVAVLLPGAYYFLGETQRPPVAALRRHRVPIALATDCNPGSSPLTSPLLAMNLACTLFRLTPAEALAGFTRHGAAALGLGARCGRLAVGLQADLALWAIRRPAELAYAMGANPLVARWRGGRLTAAPR